MIPSSLLYGGGARGPQPQEAPPAGPDTPAPLVEIGPFKGLDLWRSPLQMQDEYLTDCSMTVLDAVLGAICNAPGRVAINTGFVAPAYGMFVLRPSYPSTNTPYLFFVDGNGKIWQIDYLNGAAPVQVTLPSGLTWAATETFGAYLNHVLVITNGQTQPIAIPDNWTPTSPAARIAGVAPPQTPPFATDAGLSGGNLLGTYRWRCTYSTGGPAFGAESSAGPASSPLTLTNSGATLQLSTPADTTLNINIYRLGGSVPEWRLVATVPGTQTTYTDNVSDLSLGQLLVLDRGQPPAGLTQIVAHKGRLFGFIGNVLYFTNYNEPEAWPVAYQLPVGDGSPIVAIGTAAGSPLFIWKKRETWLLVGESINDMQLIKIWDIGCMGPRAWCAAGDVVTWLADDGFQAARFTGNGVSKWLVGTPIWSYVSSLPNQVKAKAVLASDGSRILMSFPTATPPVVYSLNTRTGDWEREKNPLWLIYGLPKYGEWEKFPFQAYDIVPLFSGDDPGYFAFAEPNATGGIDLRAWPNRSANPYTDLGSPVSWYFERARIDRGTGMTVKRYSEIEIAAPVQATGKTLTLTVTADDNSQKQYTVQFGLDNGPVRLGLPPSITGRYITIRVSGSHSQRIQIDRIRVWGWIEHRYASISQYGGP